MQGERSSSHAPIGRRAAPRRDVWQDWLAAALTLCVRARRRLLPAALLPGWVQVAVAGGKGAGKGSGGGGGLQVVVGGDGASCAWPEWGWGWAGHRGPLLLPLQALSGAMDRQQLLPQLLALAPLRQPP